MQDLSACLNTLGFVAVSFKLLQFGILVCTSAGSLSYMNGAIASLLSSADQASSGGLVRPRDLRLEPFGSSSPELAVTYLCTIDFSCKKGVFVERKRENIVVQLLKGFEVSTWQHQQGFKSVTDSLISNN
jgi:hypothetical protein